MSNDGAISITPYSKRYAKKSRFPIILFVVIEAVVVVGAVIWNIAT